MRYCCPVCKFSDLPYPPTNYNICPCCGTEFGNDDEDFTHTQLRNMWLAGGASWFFGNPPPKWNWVEQFFKGGLVRVETGRIEQGLQFKRLGNIEPEILNQRSYSYRLGP
jgi:hypothetical protein